MSGLTRIMADGRQDGLLRCMSSAIKMDCTHTHTLRMGMSALTHIMAYTLRMRMGWDGDEYSADADGDECTHILCLWAS